MSSDPRIDTLLHDLQGLDVGDRLMLAEDLQLADQINGSTDPVQQVLKRVLIGGVRNAVINHKAVRALAESHKSSCPVYVAAQQQGLEPMQVLGRSKADEITLPLIRARITGDAAKIIAVGLVMTALVLGGIFYRDASFRKAVIQDVQKLMEQRK